MTPKYTKISHPKNKYPIVFQRITHSHPLKNIHFFPSRSKIPLNGPSLYFYFFSKKSVIANSFAATIPLPLKPPETPKPLNGKNKNLP
ncbi:hypothetical protein ACM44_11840 [Chryseobacterium koreense CCUG 49689]|uniref:Uncharacterized protein n=1 Tax=Chryseobacterium koreense CCUG 49689 TaxID=1304281 RepID=A0A0J7IXB9_9FLAO|nr:hypothetical protein ACM44_11840 [Chryseobacterium koreense CCUG 49689]